MRRLQEYEWHEYRKVHHLVLMFVSVSSSGNYRADMLDEYSNHVYHWLNNKEITKLKKSDYFKTHAIFDSNCLYRGEHVKEVREKIRSLEHNEITIDELNQYLLSLKLNKEEVMLWVKKNY